MLAGDLEYCISWPSPEGHLLRWMMRIYGGLGLGLRWALISTGAPTLSGGWD
ncbi:uncharacterized protein EI90DRAFT_3038506, partial [Cantharellus anzutake]|uniref:uncharacterized protein n=1 Tax=Cantharellus anzutake TaxID=1750568 RepID=UPI001908FC66